MDNDLNTTIIEKVTTKSVAIHIALTTMCPPSFEDKFKKETICQKNTQMLNSEKSLNVVEPNKENETKDTTNDIKINSEKKSWKDITDPKLKRKMRQKRYYEKHKNDTIKSYYQNNKEKIKLKSKEWRKNNRDKERLRKKNYRIKNKNNLNHKLSLNLRNRLNQSVKNNFKSGSAVKDLGCSIEEFKTYIESKFQPGMSWDNWAHDGWHIDHIKPLASFDLTKHNQLLEACHYTNLQPLWASDNYTKGDH